MRARDDDRTAFRRAGNRYAAAASELDEALVAKHAEGAEHGVRVYAEDGGEILRRRKTFSRPCFAVGNCPPDLCRNLNVQRRRLFAVDLDTEHGDTHSSFIQGRLVDATAAGQAQIVSPQPSRTLRQRLTALIKEARERALRRRRRIAATGVLLAVAAAVLMFGGFFNDGGPGRAPTSASPTTRAFLTPRATAASGPVTNGPLTLIANHHVPYDSEQIAAVGVFGATGPVFDCPAAKGCYELTSFAWAPNGRWLAFGADSVSIPSDYNGLHLYNPTTRRDVRLSSGDILQLSWSHDGSKLAYLAAFPNPPGSIYVRDLTSAEPALLKTGTAGRDAAPTWSPDGRRIAFATRTVESRPHGHWIISTIALDGTHRRFLARGGSPAWSPDGRLIAYRGACGRIRLMTSTGNRVLPASAGRGGCAEIGVGGPPVWSPDGTQIAMPTRSGTYVMDRDGGHLWRVTPESGLGAFTGGLPAWQPLPKR
jgi:WD40-like Beta Propeller Repeat